MCRVTEGQSPAQYKRSPVRKVFRTPFSATRAPARALRRPAHAAAPSGAGVARCSSASARGAADGRPGFVRVESTRATCGSKGVYLINVVDEVTQFEYVGAVAAISERFLVPVLEGLLDLFPFAILGFHADNGSEYINHRVAALLAKLHAEFTKSRARHSNDNALAEGKNASVVRKWFGHAHIPRRFAPLVDRFARDVLSPALNFHRPCMFPVEHADDDGRLRKRYPHDAVTTPYERLKSPAGLSSR